MASYKVYIKRSAEKELRSIPKSDIQKIIDKIRNLQKNPRPHGSMLLAGTDSSYRLRQGDYRILYDIDDEAEEVVIYKIGHRREVYL